MVTSNGADISLLYAMVIIGRHGGWLLLKLNSNDEKYMENWNCPKTSVHCLYILTMKIHTTLTCVFTACCCKERIFFKYSPW